MSAATPIVEIEGLRKSYNIGTPVEAEVLHGIDLVLMRSEFAALIGPSGSGKSTLLNILGLLERPTAGRYRLDGRPTEALGDDALTAARLANLGFVFQFHHLLPAFSAIEKVHPEEEHYYLEALGTRQDMQSKGVGSSVIGHMLDRCDAEGLPAYLESGPEGCRAARVLHQGTAMTSALAALTGFVVLAEDCTTIRPGDVVRYSPVETYFH